MEEGRGGSAGGGAEAVVNLGLNCSLPICYHPQFGSHEDLLFLELDDKLLPDILNNQVTVRGQPNEEAVLCTPSATYALKFVGNSNSVFLIPPINANDNEDHDDSIINNDRENNKTQSISPAYVIKVSPGNMELVQVAPKLDKLKSLLAEKPYRAEDEEEDANTIGLYRWHDLVNRIQASDEELRSGLRALSAAEINGYWRIADEKFMAEILTTLLNNSVLYGWSLNALAEDEVVAVLVADGYSRRIAIHCLETYGTKKQETVEDSCVWSLDERRVCLHFVRRILSGGKRRMESFMEDWERNVPEGMQVSFEMLEGEVLVERIGIETWVRAFSVSSLPSSAPERFAALFHERQKWEWKDLQPYIKDLSVPGLSSEGLLIKYTRRTQPTSDAEPIFSAR
ncbi:uncharacterized protein LOC143884250 [Tasmannia lanceolata]|uniref:uncharacterized protein LOC143856463 n=1 Tax=Tasmannia lanceolata TaxID=3420 RepID=UPI004062A9A6